MQARPHATVPTLPLTRTLQLCALALTLIASTNRAQATYNPPPPCANPFTPQQEVTEGSKVAAKVYQQMPVLPETDPVSIYVAQLGAHLASHAPGLKWPYTFHVVASSDVNAFALPGGAIFVNLGTIQAAQTEAQLAGVLAHETSHVVLRHATCNMKKCVSKSS
jgi:beta-barrel assembly-enhancing protease